MGWVVKATARSLYPREKPGTHFIRGWVAPRAVRKISSLRGFLHRFINLFYWLRFLWVSSVQENGGITVHKHTTGVLHILLMIPSAITLGLDINLVDSVTCADTRNCLPQGITHTLHL